jgi:pseudouridine-5'-phosphate glycosidase
MLHLSEQVREALDGGRAVVALESTVISHGLPYPTNLETARRTEEIVREHGAVPATIAVLDGKIRVGVTGDELEHLATAKGIRKTSRRDLPIVVAQHEDGATTVAATATVAAWAGIEIFATGGIGGVHRDPGYDISNDLPTLASTRITVVCAGAKAILDLRATVEWLETAGVPVIGYGTDEFPAFYTRQSGLPVDERVDGPQEAASIIRAGREMGLPGGTLIVVPVPAADEMNHKKLQQAINSALSEASARGIEGSASTPFLLRWVTRETGGASLKANVSLLENNAAVAAQIAVALREMS